LTDNTIEILDHTADIGLRLRRPTLEALFVDAALAMFQKIIAPAAHFEAMVEEQITLQAADLEQLFVAWLAEVNFLFQTRLFVPVAIHLSFTAENEIVAHLSGECIDREKHEIAAEIKGVTFCMLNIQQEKSGWLAQVIFDI
jgi:SHS2 domain-containing protein